MAWAGGRHSAKIARCDVGSATFPHYSPRPLPVGNFEKNAFPNKGAYGLRRQGRK